jgi:hypothetical protein
MYPLQSIVDFLMNRVTRLPAPERTNALCGLLAGMLPQMDIPDVNLVREQVVVRFWTMPEIANPALDMIDGHLALRALLPELTAENGDGPEDYSL